MPTITSSILAAVVMLVGSTVLSTVGFGIGMTTIPVLLFVFDPQTVIVVVNAVSLVLFTLIVFYNRADIPGRRVIPWAVTGLVGVPVGVLFLKGADAGLLKIAISAVIIVLTLIVASNVKTPIPRGTASGVVVAFVVSVMLNALGIGGPIMALYVLAQGWTRSAFRGSLSLYFLFVETAGIIGYGFAGLLTKERLGLILILTPPVLLGFWLGTRLVRRMDERIFRRAVVAVILLTSAMVLTREISAL